MSALSTAQVRLLARLRAGNINANDVKLHEIRTLNILQNAGLAVFHMDMNASGDENKDFWAITEHGLTAIPTSGDEQANTANLTVSEIAVEVVTADVPHTFKRGEIVEFLKAFPKPEEKGKWIMGRYFGLYPGDNRLACIRVKGIGEAARVGEIRSLEGSNNPAPDGWEIIKPLPPITIKLSREVVMSAKRVFNEVAEKLGEPLLETSDIPTNGKIEDAPFKPVPTREEDELGHFLATASSEEKAEFASELAHASHYDPAVAQEVSSYEIAHDAELATQSTFDQLAADEPSVDPEADTEPTPTVKENLTVQDPFNGMAEMELNLQLIPVNVRQSVRMEELSIAPAAFKQVTRGVFMSSAKVFARKNQWQGEVWAVGRWTSRLGLVLAIDGTLLMLDGVMAYEVRTSQATLDVLFTAWAGLGWRVRPVREAATVGGAK
jgi:hypothetical protein